MPNEVRYTTPTTLATALTTELNSLGAGSVSGLSAAIDNRARGMKYLNVWLHLASLTPAGAKTISLIIAVSVDGTNYATPQAGGTLAVLSTWTLNTTTEAKEIVSFNVAIPPALFKLGVYNNAGVAFAASGNTLKYTLHTEYTA